MPCCPNGPRTATAAENRAYDAHVRSLGGSKSPAAKAWIEAEHQKYKASVRNHRCSGKK